MVKDLELMMNIHPLFEKNIVIWGVGAFGRESFERFIQLGVDREHILLCDSDPQKYGGNYKGYEIASPDQLKKIINKTDYVIFIAAISLNTQDDILKTIKNLGLEDVDAYTEYAIRWGVYLNQRDCKIPLSNQQGCCGDDRMKIENTYLELQRLKYFTFAPMYEEMILIYQPPKVGSTSIHESILAAGKYALHVHELREIQYSEGNIKKMAQMHNARIISLVRDPVARAMSLLWFSLRRKKPYHVIVENGGQGSLGSIQKAYFYDGFENQEFQWFDKEMKKVFGINVYEYPFDRERGYSIIKQDNLEVMLLTTEKINDLEEEIGNFVGIDNFKLETKNTASKSDYRFAYSEYKEKVSLARSMLDRVYFDNSYMRHFYTESMINKFYHQWETHIDDNCTEQDVMIRL